MSQKKFDALKWYKKHSDNKKLNKRNTKSLSGFLLIWSALEYGYFNNRIPLSKEGLLELGRIANNLIIPNDYLRFIHHFHHRYFIKIEDEEILFNTLNLEHKHEEFVRSTIRNCFPPENFIPSLFLIANRFRNNFIHGRKEPIKLHLYEKQFNILNKFLTKFIDETFLNGEINKNRLNNRN